MVLSLVTCKKSKCQKIAVTAPGTAYHELSQAILYTNSPALSDTGPQTPLSNTGVVRDVSGTRRRHERVVAIVPIVVK